MYNLEPSVQDNESHRHLINNDGITFLSQSNCSLYNTIGGDIFEIIDNL